jgi:hypothetical protein
MDHLKSGTEFDNIGVPNYQRSKSFLKSHHDILNEDIKITNVRDIPSASALGVPIDRQRNSSIALNIKSVEYKPPIKQRFKPDNFAGS